MYVEQLIFKAIADEVVEGAPAVLPADFLAFGVGAPVIDDRDFVDTRCELGDLHRHFGFDAEAVGVQMHAVDEVAGEDLVAGGDVMDGDARQQIADDRKQPVKQKTVVTLDTMWAAMEAVAKDGV